MSAKCSKKEMIKHNPNENELSKTLTAINKKCSVHEKVVLDELYARMETAELDLEVIQAKKDGWWPEPKHIALLADVRKVRDDLQITKDAVEKPENKYPTYVIRMVRYYEAALTALVDKHDKQEVDDE